MISENLEICRIFSKIWKIRRLENKALNYILMFVIIKKIIWIRLWIIYHSYLKDSIEIFKLKFTINIFNKRNTNALESESFFRFVLGQLNSILIWNDLSESTQYIVVYLLRFINYILRFNVIILFNKSEVNKVSSGCRKFSPAFQFIKLSCLSKFLKWMPILITQIISEFGSLLYASYLFLAFRASFYW